MNLEKYILNDMNPGRILTLSVIFSCLISSVHSQKEFSVGVNMQRIIFNPFSTHTPEVFEKKILMRSFSGITIRSNDHNLNKRLNLSFISFKSDYLLSDLISIFDYDESNKGKFSRITSEIGIEKPLTTKRLIPYPYMDLIFCFSQFKGTFAKFSAWNPDPAWRTSKYDQGVFGLGTNLGIGIKYKISDRMSITYETGGHYIFNFLKTEEIYFIPKRELRLNPVSILSLSLKL